MSDNTINASFRRMGFDGETIVGHGFRATARDHPGRSPGLSARYHRAPVGPRREGPERPGLQPDRLSPPAQGDDADVVRLPRRPEERSQDDFRQKEHQEVGNLPEGSATPGFAAPVRTRHVNWPPPHSMHPTRYLDPCLPKRDAESSGLPQEDSLFNSCRSRILSFLRSRQLSSAMQSRIKVEKTVNESLARKCQNAQEATAKRQADNKRSPRSLIRSPPRIETCFLRTTWNHKGKANDTKPTATKPG